ncbi:MAG: replication protein [Cressdnaviricota sp.]|nr:MAG: replication protein [Cressdnaviricota sp.]
MTEHFEQNLKGEGNVNPPPTYKFQAVSWTGNIHFNNKNEILEYFEQISKILHHFKWYVFGEEYGVSGTTPHIQFAITFKKKQYQSFVFQIFNKKFFCEKMKGKFSQQDYCLKEGNKTLTNFKFPKPLKLMTKDHLKPWQLEIAERFNEAEDPLFGRKINWFYDFDGGIGKSILCKYLVDQRGALLLGGANKDCLFGLFEFIKINKEAPEIVIFDIPRVNKGAISYQALEQIKNGMFFNSKYESGMCRFNSPHILIFSNDEPDYGSLSQDRWVVEELCPSDGD